MKPTLGLVLALAACDGGTVTVRGTVMHRAGDKSRGLPEATIVVRDALGAPFDEAATGPTGRFRVLAPRANRIYAEILAEGYVPAAFTGSSGLGDRLVVEDGLLFGVSEGEAAAWRERFAGCPGASAGAFAVGQVRAFNLSDPETGEAPVITTAQVSWRRVDGQTVGACYLDPEGLAWDPDAERTGASGWYLIPDLPGGVGAVRVDYTAFDELDPLDITYDAFAPVDGVVPVLPTWVDIPGPL